ncbi:MAG: hypothetical protein SOZ07_07930 [Prevotella sp.]|nr:hypothetical protein [Prevotella sp.]MDD7272756.1 hypothetical protein [Prevotellaceae bacterium]MDY3936560.1 hypothetical protein [Prevotella sp.]MDY4218298.1 hypothetical protein [Prevotella sp.]
MTANEKILNTFATRVRQMILHYQELQQENDELYALVGEQEAEIARLKAQLELSKNEYQALKMARMLEVSDGDIESAQKRVAKLIRDVNKCITLLSEK